MPRHGALFAHDALGIVLPPLQSVFEPQFQPLPQHYDLASTMAHHTHACAQLALQQNSESLQLGQNSMVMAGAAFGLGLALGLHYGVTKPVSRQLSVWIAQAIREAVREATASTSSASVPTNSPSVGLSAGVLGAGSGVAAVVGGLPLAYSPGQAGLVAVHGGVVGRGREDTPPGSPFFGLV